MRHLGISKSHFILYFTLSSKGRYTFEIRQRRGQRFSEAGRPSRIGPNRQLLQTQGCKKRGCNISHVEETRGLGAKNTRCFMARALAYRGRSHVQRRRRVMIHPAVPRWCHDRKCDGLLFSSAPWLLLITPRLWLWPGAA